jgi:arginase
MMDKRFLVPYLMGQYRPLLGRVGVIDTSYWEQINVPGCGASRIEDRGEQMASMARIYARLASRVRDVVMAGMRPISISGDCVSTLGMLAGLQQAGRTPQRVLWLDAHGDFHTWGTTQTQYLGGMPLAMLVGRQDRRRNARDTILALRQTIGCEPYPEQQVLLSDARDLDPGEDEALHNSAIVCCKVDQVGAMLSAQESLYVHFDTDVLDARQQMPALKYHVAAGPTIADLAALFRHLRTLPVVAVSVSAWHSEQDQDDQAALTTLELVNLLLQG